jgi:hypothetical protein
MRLAYLLPLLLFACTTTRQLSEERHQEQHRREKMSELRDSTLVYRQDSTFILVKGDSVFVDRWHVRYTDRVLVRVDSFLRFDSVYVDTYQEVVREPSRWDVFWQMLGKILALIAFLLLVGLLLMWKFRK